MGRFIHLRCVCRVIYKHVRHEKSNSVSARGELILAPSETYDDTLP